MHPFHEHHVQVLQPNDYAIHTALHSGILVSCKLCATDPLFPAKVLFSSEAFFTWEVIFNMHNAHMLAEANPHAIQRRAAQTQFLVNVWPCIIGDHYKGPYLLLFRLTDPNYIPLL